MRRAPPIRAALLRWYLRERRDLPWRRTRDPYAIWVSEIMLQQTRVETVIPYYERFLARFPDVGALARAPESAVLASWSGLGYYGRARNLKRAAETVVREHAGALPDDPDSLRRLPGIGGYTAAAIASVAFGHEAAAVDGNVIRVLARIEGLRGRRDAGPLRRRVEEVAASLAVGPRPGDWTQALMELGAVICLPREPLCARCPVARHCRATASGAPERYPGAARPATARPERRLLLAASRGARYLLIPGNGGRDGAWSLPSAALRDGGRPVDGERDGARAYAAAARAARALARSLGLDGAVEGPLARFRHRTFSHDTAFEVWRLRIAAPRKASSRSDAPGSAPRGGVERPGRDRRWAGRADLERLPVRAPTLKAFEALRARPSRDRRRLS